MAWVCSDRVGREISGCALCAGALSTKQMCWIDWGRCLAEGKFWLRCRECAGVEDEVLLGASVRTAHCQTVSLVPESPRF